MKKWLVLFIVVTLMMLSACGTNEENDLLDENVSSQQKIEFSFEEKKIKNQVIKLRNKRMEEKKHTMKHYAKRILFSGVWITALLILIEFLMLLKNLTKTSYFIKHGLPFIARNHDEPDHEGLTAWNRLLNTRGYRVDIKKKYGSSDIRRSRDSYKGCPEEVVLDYIGIRKLAKANYGAYNNN